jgi:hypothetical protein
MKMGHKTNFCAWRSLTLPLVAGFLLSATESAPAQSGQGASPEADVSYAAEPAAGKPGAAETSEREWALLKAQLAAQQEQITMLRKVLEEQSKLIERVLQTQANASGSSIQVAATQSFSPALAASRSPVMPSPGPVPTAGPLEQSDQEARAEEPKAPLSFRIGTVDITPLGFMDFTGVIRDKNMGSGITSNFGAIPFNNTVSGNLREYQFSAQHSRLGLRLDARLREVKLLSYLETDFLGVVPGNVAVTSHSDTQRLRLFWLDVRKGRLEFLGGQSWSLMVPNRKGLSPLPADIFVTQGFDPNLHVGLTWTRNPQLRFVYHPSETVALGLSVEASEQFAGGASGSGEIILPSQLAPHYGSQLNTGTDNFATPNPHQDIIAKIAFDPKVGNRSLHFEVGGVLTRFAFFNPVSNQHFNAAGGGGSFNFNVELVKNLRLVVNTFYSSGAGRYIFGLGPDVIIQGDGSPSLVHSASTLNGFEYQATPKTGFFAYYGSAYFQKNVAIDPANGQPVGFGYSGSPSNHNRLIHQGTFGFAHTFWRDPSYGGLQLGMQYSYLVRHPWYVAPDQPGSAYLNMLYLSLRYFLPGAPPAAQK